MSEYPEHFVYDVTFVALLIYNPSKLSLAVLFFWFIIHTILGSPFVGLCRGYHWLLAAFLSSDFAEFTYATTHLMAYTLCLCTCIALAFHKIVDGLRE